MEADRVFFLMGGPLGGGIKPLGRGGVAFGSFLGGFGVVLGLIGSFFLMGGGLYLVLSHCAVRHQINWICRKFCGCLAVQVPS